MAESGTKRPRLSGEMVAKSKPHVEEDDDLRSMFNAWAKSYNKVYINDDEREKRFKVFLENKKYVDECNSQIRNDVLGLNNFADKRASEIAYGGCIVRYTPPHYVGMRPDPMGMNSEELKVEKNGQASMSSSKEMRKRFDSWARSNRKVYSSDQERQERFQIFVSTVKYLDEQNSLIMLTSDGEPYGLNSLSDRRDHEVPFGCSIVGFNPPDHLWMTEDEMMNNEEFKEKWNEFERWAAAYNKVYASEEERRFRFLIFLNKKSIFEIDKWEPSPVDFWTHRDFDWSGMDLMGMEM